MIRYRHPRKYNGEKLNMYLKLTENTNSTQKFYFANVVLVTKSIYIAPESRLKDNSTDEPYSDPCLNGTFRLF